MDFQQAANIPKGLCLCDSGSILQGAEIATKMNANMDGNEELPFREESNKELYADIPSDNESGNDSDAKDIDSEVSDE
ncbi:hypothetical protein JTB14_034724 [Gonioctena quinquepunctata]|nr:hypothetical protein JTB14_034724 [Gonioctena quinquepunctata]